MDVHSWKDVVEDMSTGNPYFKNDMSLWSQYPCKYSSHILIFTPKGTVSWCFIQVEVCECCNIVPDKEWTHICKHRWTACHWRTTRHIINTNLLTTVCVPVIYYLTTLSITTIILYTTIYTTIVTGCNCLSTDAFVSLTKSLIIGLWLCVIFRSFCIAVDLCMI